MGIQLVGDLDAKWRKALGQEVHRIFNAAGLNPLPPKPQILLGEVSLEVTITTIHLKEGSQRAEFLLGGSCGEKWLYDAKIELWEHMYSSRNPEQPVYSQIWGQYHKYPTFKEYLEYEDVRAELEDMLLQFITDYRLANPKSSDR